MPTFTHLDEKGRVRMVDVSEKAATVREAVAQGVITMRPETEWTETVDDGWNILVGAEKEKIMAAIANFNPHHQHNNHYGDGHASEKIARLLGDI